MKLGFQNAGRFSLIAVFRTLVPLLVFLPVLLVPGANWAGVFSLDDGGVDTFGGTPGGDLLALNHFDTGGRTVAIDQISVIWNPLSSAVSPTVALYSDPNGDGNPADAEALLVYPIYIPPNVVILGNTSFQTYSIPTTVVEGSFFVGAYLSDRDSSFNPVIGVDLTHPQSNQSWIIEHTSVGGLDLMSPAASGTLVAPLGNYINGNHMIRANYTELPGPFCVHPPAGLVSWWRAEGDALDARDSNNGAVVGDAMMGAGHVGQSFLFDGDRDGIRVGNATNLQLQNFTIEAWIKRASPTVVSFNGNGNGHIFSMGTTGGYGFYVDAQGYLTLASLQVNGVVSDALVTDTNWHHVAVTKFQTAVVFYLDGVAHGAPAYDSGGFVFAAPGYIGAWEFAGTVENSFYGAIDEVAVYNRPLTPLEVRELFIANSAGKCVLPPGGPPVILNHPQDQVKPPGGIATFAVVATGSAPLSYQWYLNGNALEGRTNAAITLANVQTIQAGTYSVMVSDVFGTATSSNAQLVVTSSPWPACVPLPAGAVAWWRAESNTVDSVGLNDGFWETTQPAALSYVPGKSGAAFRFLTKTIFPPTRDTSSSSVSIPASSDLDLGDGDGLTIEGWINPASVSGVQPLVEWNDGLGNIGAGLALAGSAVEVSLTDTNGPAPRRLVLRSPGGIVVTSIWQHVALTFDRAGGVVATYLNGTLVARTNLGLFVPQTQTPVFLAWRPSGTYALAHYVGGMDEVTLYKRALTSEEVRAMVAADSVGKCPPPPPPCVPLPSDCVAWWRGESNALDNVANSHGNIVGSVSYASGVVGKAIVFQNGLVQNGYVQVSASSNLNVGTASGMTVEAWISPTFGTLSLPKLREFFTWRNGAALGVSLSVSNFAPSLFDSTPAWRADLVDVQGVHHVIRAMPVAGNQWQHVAVTYDKMSGEAALYLNGNPVTQTNLGTFTPNTTGDLYFGYQDSLGQRAILGGAMDEIALYRRALTPAEIRAIVMTRGTGKCKSPPSVVFQPVGRRVNPGTDVQFDVVAGGNAMLRYQWFRDSAPLSGATNASLLLAAVQDVQAGNYAVRVTNWFGGVLSSNAVLRVNHAPTADAGATMVKVISASHQNATVVLDGSRSSDPDGDPLQFAWFEAGAANPIATGVVVAVVLPLGQHPITLVVDDGLATNSQTLTVEVITTAQALECLRSLVNDRAPKPHPLLAVLSAAIAAIERNNPTAALNQLQAFQNQVRAQVAPEDPMLAELLLRKSQEVMDILGGETKAHGRGHFTKIEREANGNVRLQFSAPAALVCIVEASTNLVDWEAVGTAPSIGDGYFEFEDPNSTRVPFRYYRILQP